MHAWGIDLSSLCFAPHNEIGKIGTDGIQFHSEFLVSLLRPMMYRSTCIGPGEPRTVDRNSSTQ